MNDKQSDDFLIFAPEQEITPLPPTGSWNILIVDDENSVHHVTEFALKDFVFDNRQLHFHSVFSAAEAIDLLTSSDTEFHVIFLDIVMENRSAGLGVITFIRHELKKNNIQIIVRTGNPGLAPEGHIIQHFDINNYESKNTLTVQRLKTTLISALRSYRNIEAIETIVAHKIKQVEALRQTIRHVTFATPDAASLGNQTTVLMTLPYFLRHPQQPKVTDTPSIEPHNIPDVGLSLQFIQGKIASTARKAIAIFDYTTCDYRYFSDNMEEITGASWQSMIQKFQKDGHYSPDLQKIDKINKYLIKAYKETPEQEKSKFVAIIDYRITPTAPQNIRILEYATPLLYNSRGDLVLSLHIFSNINHLKKADANSVLALHVANEHQYFSISDYRIDEIFFGSREQEILEHADKSLASKDIAKLINLSVHTVDTHLRNLRDRLGVTSTNALISYCKEISHLF